MAHLKRLLFSFHPQSIFLWTLIHQVVLLYLVSPRENFGKYTSSAILYLDGSLPPERVLDFSPFYFDLNVLLAASLPSPGQALFAIQILVLAFTSSILCSILANYFVPRISWVTALVLSFNQGPIVWARTFEPEIWILLWNILATYYLLQYLRNYTRLKFLLLSVFFLALSIYTRPTSAVLIPFFLGALFLNNRKVFLKNAVVIVSVILISIGCLSLRNYLYTGNRSVAVMDSGAVFYESNNPYSNGYSSNTPLIKDLEGQYIDQPDYAHVLEKNFPSAVLNHRVTAHESNIYWSRKAFNFISDHPLAFLKLGLVKLELLFRSYGSHDIAQARSLEIELNRLAYPFIPFSVISGFALIGMWLHRRQYKTSVFYYGGFFAYMLFCLLFYVSSRQRLPILPFLLFFFAAFLNSVWTLIEARQFRKISLLIVIGAAISVFIDLPSKNVEQQEHVWIGIEKSQAFQVKAADLRNSDRRALAASLVAESIAAAPYLHELRVLSNLPYVKSPLHQASVILRKNMDAHDDEVIFDYGFLLMEMREWDQAEQIFKILAGRGIQFHRWNYCSPEPLYYLARIAEAKNSPDALNLYKQALDLEPGNPEILAHLSVLLEKRVMMDESQLYRNQLFDYFDEIDAVNFLGKAYWDSGLYTKSSEMFLKVIHWLPDYRKGYLYAAASLGMQGNISNGISLYRKAMLMKEDPLILEAPILKMFRRNERLNPDSGIASSMFGIVLRQYGYFDEAAKYQKKALELDPQFKTAQAELTSLTKIISEASKEAN